MTTDTLEVVGYFTFDCQEDGYCTYGCGKRPLTLCRECVEFIMWVEGEPMPDNLHPFYEREDEEYQDVCDYCEEMF